MGYNDDVEHLLEGMQVSLSLTHTPSLRIWIKIEASMTFFVVFFFSPSSLNADENTSGLRSRGLIRISSSVYTLD